MSDWWIWAALTVGVVATLAALILLAVRVLQAWRDLKRARRHLFKALNALLAKGERAAEKAASAAETEELATTLGRLRGTLARFAVLRDALAEAQATVGRVTAFVPHK